MVKLWPRCGSIGGPILYYFLHFNVTRNLTAYHQKLDLLFVANPVGGGADLATFDLFKVYQRTRSRVAAASSTEE